MEVDDYKPVKMVVVDGIVMGPTHCAYDNCTEELQNARGGAFCIQHKTAYGNVCRMWTCGNQRVAGTLACATHQGRIDENLPWQQRGPQPAARAHDNNEDDDDPPPRAHFFGSSKFYCVETVCAPCGVVIAWTKFDKSESPTCILNFLQSIFPTAESRPGYVCIDKACRVLKWCNPAPLNGSAPNLVQIAYDKNGRLCLQRAYNTEASEQLNAWLGGFESILKQMKIGNFDWFLHTMMFYHTQQVIAKQKKKEKVVNMQQEEEEEEEDDDDDDEGPARHWNLNDNADEIVD
ncbi:hypothetical protein CPB84DRAFT_1908281 [Gymnopilus junonius]|uniref:CxC6 like cysteine cluster associated with KDZ domain-containing protein n=1 Tax=Gymnopilus junonius TaxID=109634 RepID=A0A9P5N6V2_GYMJU|nr:hypothetical protein CPB84DRAFT_1908281 [Gymnopilus junonius]